MVQERYERLVALQERISFERNEESVGRTQEVLVEGVSKKDPAKLTGRTRTNKLVHFPSDGAAEGTLRRVRITDAHPHHLDGELVDETRMSLPLAGSVAGCSC
jgi:tRNA-2-methylthio-N6-dimethylallyladenosine synthase